MKRYRLIFSLLIILFSINFVLANSCTDSDSKEKAGVYPRGLNYYQNGVNSGENKLGIWNQEDFCKGNNLYESYCYYSNKQYYNGTAIYKCPKGCNVQLKACNQGTFVTGKAIDSLTGTYLSIFIILILIILLIWILFKNKNKKTFKKKKK